MIKNTDDKKTDQWRALRLINNNGKKNPKGFS